MADDGSPPTFTCPRCGATSSHPTDATEGYCGRCHAWTGDGPSPAYSALVRASLALIPDMPTGWEPAGQSMDTTIRQGRIREWRAAVVEAARELGVTP